MMSSVKDLVSSIGNSGFARRLGRRPPSLAKRISGSAAGLAKGAGGSAVGLARKIGPRRGLLGLAAVGAAVGTVYLVRYLRANRREDAEGIIDTSDHATSSRRLHKQTRAQRMAADDGVTH